ncbi:unnamed protein product [Prorocentrum cordatum]|uniref:SMB domain-containing protein n=1 Tax=Prorocentrum cordatum TaxID=2364126 RepID=A0ABN9UQF3_9DINO|nr:unnamed protein product [Polarella glacialis]
MLPDLAGAVTRGPRQRRRLRLDACVLQAYSISGEKVVPPGDITFAELELWFASSGDMVKLMVIELTAEELTDHIERGLSPLPGESWRLLHLSSALRCEADLSLPAGRRITRLLFHGEPLPEGAVLCCAVAADFARWAAPQAPRLVDEEGAVSLVEVLLRRLRAVGEVDEAWAPRGRLQLRGDEAAAPGAGGGRALGAPRAGLPAVSSDFDAARESYRNAGVLLGLGREHQEGRPVVVATGNFSKLVRLVEVFAKQRVPVERAPPALPLHLRPQICPGHASRPLSGLERDCIRKLLAYPPGVLVSVASLCVEPQGPTGGGDQWFFVDDTPAGTQIYVKDRIHRGVDSPALRFRPSRSLSESVGKSASITVMFGRAGATSAGQLLCEFFEGGTVYGQMCAPRGVDLEAPCLPFEYVFKPRGGGGLTIAEARGEEWARLARAGQPRLLDAGPYAAAARRFLTGVPSSEATVQGGMSPPALLHRRFDCNHGYEHWESDLVGWSEPKKAWCCERAHRGCGTTSTPTSTEAPTTSTAASTRGASTSTSASASASAATSAARRQALDLVGAIPQPGSCAAYGCSGFNLSRPCQCNARCQDFGDCCPDFPQTCPLAALPAALGPALAAQGGADGAADWENVDVVLTVPNMKLRNTTLVLRADSTTPARGGTAPATSTRSTTSTTAPAGPGGHGFCCTAASDSADTCGTCWPGARSGPSNWCGPSLDRCRQCGGTWCGPHPAAQDRVDNVIVESSQHDARVVDGSGRHWLLGALVVTAAGLTVAAGVASAACRALNRPRQLLAYSAYGRPLQRLYEQLPLQSVVEDELDWRPAHESHREARLPDRPGFSMVAAVRDPRPITVSL